MVKRKLWIFCIEENKLNLKFELELNQYKKLL